METQLHDTGYKTDLYLHNSKLAIESYEKGHANRDVDYENKRQAKVEKRTGLWIHKI